MPFFYKTEDHLAYMQELLKNKHISSKYYDKVVYLLKNKKFLKNVDSIRKKYQIPTEPTQIEIIQGDYENKVWQELKDYYVYKNWDDFQKKFIKMLDDNDVDIILREHVEGFVIAHLPIYKADDFPMTWEVDEEDNLCFPAFTPEMKNMRDKKYEIFHKNDRLFIEIFPNTLKKDLNEAWDECKLYKEKLPLIKYEKVPVTDEEAEFIIGLLKEGKTIKKITELFNRKFIIDTNKYIGEENLRTWVNRLKKQHRIEPNIKK